LSACDRDRAATANKTSEKNLAEQIAAAVIAIERMRANRIIFGKHSLGTFQGSPYPEWLGFAINGPCSASDVNVFERCSALRPLLYMMPQCLSLGLLVDREVLDPCQEISSIG
jgi:hypothetical protein